MKPLEQIISYQVPVVLDGGDCTGAGELGTFHYEQHLPFELDEDRTALLLQLDLWMEKLHALERIDWCGVYMAIPEQPEFEINCDSLLKLVYRGDISRGLFPLTEEFACSSNNSTVGITGKPIIIDDVYDYIKSGGCYYECDERVKSEYCHPFFKKGGEVIGIIDLESFSKATFSDEEMMSELEPALEQIEELLQRFVA